ncbi:MAG: hypothetical protein K2J26_07065, partial [Ruminococcus sp.]|nr:hypothetical protein [Ruminococcus sp.]
MHLLSNIIQLIYTDPSNPDSDNDNLEDGQEIDPKPYYSDKELFSTSLELRIVKGYFFKMKSDPNLVDTDYDGINDN